MIDVSYMADSTAVSAEKETVDNPLLDVKKLRKYKKVGLPHQKVTTG